MKDNKRWSIWAMWQRKQAKHTVDDKLTLSATSIGTFQTCRRRYEYEKVKHIYPVDKPVALSFGSAIHAGLAMAIRFLGGELELEKIKKCAVEAAFEVEGLSDEDRAKVEVLLFRYIDLYLESDNQYEVEAIEKSYTLPIVNPKTGIESTRYFLTGFVDAVYRDKDGKLHIIEHKTSSMANDDYFDRVDIDIQVAIYADLLSRSTGEDVRSVIYDVIKKPKHVMNAGETDAEYEERKAASKTGRIKRKEAETYDGFKHRLELAVGDDCFVRKEIVLTDETMDEYRRELWAIANEMGKCHEYYKCSGNCLKFGACPYMPLCKAHGNTEGLEDLYTGIRPR